MRRLFYCVETTFVVLILFFYYRVQGAARAQAGAGDDAAGDRNERPGVKVTALFFLVGLLGVQLLQHLSDCRHGFIRILAPPAFLYHLRAGGAEEIIILHFSRDNLRPCLVRPDHAFDPRLKRFGHHYLGRLFIRALGDAVAGKLRIFRVQFETVDLVGEDPDQLGEGEVRRADIVGGEFRVGLVAAVETYPLFHEPVGGLDVGLQDRSLRVVELIVELPVPARDVFEVVPFAAEDVLHRFRHLLIGKIVIQLVVQPALGLKFAAHGDDIVARSLIGGQFQVFIEVVHQALVGEIARHLVESVRFLLNLVPRQHLHQVGILDRGIQHPQFLLHAFAVPAVAPYILVGVVHADLGVPELYHQRLAVYIRVLLSGLVQRLEGVAFAGGAVKEHNHLLALLDLFGQLIWRKAGFAVKEFPLFASLLIDLSSAKRAEDIRILGHIHGLGAGHYHQHLFINGPSGGRVHDYQ